MNLNTLFENISPQQRRVGQLPADFSPRDTSPVLDGPYGKENATQGYLVGEGAGDNALQVGDPVIITGNVEYQGKTGDVREVGRDGAFVVVDLYNHGPYSFHSSDVSYNDYADSDEEDERAQGVAEGHADQQRKIFKKNGQPVGEVGIDRESSPGVGQYYMKHYASGKDLSGFDSFEEAVQELRHLTKQGVAEGSLNEAATMASVSKLLRHIERHNPTWFDDYGMGEVEDAVVDMAEQGTFSGMTVVDAAALVGQELESMYGANGMNEAEYQGRKVPLGKPMAGDVKKSKVYVKNPQGRVVKVNFGQKGMKIKKSIPGRRKNFRARHNCDNPGPRHKARYWSCRAW